MNRQFLLLPLLSFLSIPASAAPFHIVAAENFYGGIAHQIAGDHAEVVSILTDPAQDPHKFTGSAAAARAVADADVIIYNGLGYDTWMEKLLSAPGKPGRIVINVSTLTNHRDGDNPHIWYDFFTMPALVGKLAPLLAMADSANAYDYMRARSAFSTSLEPLMVQIGNLRRRTRGLTAAATEPVFGYMTNGLGFKMLDTHFQDEIMHGSKPGANEIASFEQGLKTHQARLLFYNTQVTNPTTERLRQSAQQAGVPIINVPELEPADQPDYAGWMLHEIAQVDAALPEKNSEKNP